MAFHIGNIFRTLGIVGWDRLEAPMLCALKTKTPVNFIGDMGASKTEAAYKISVALQGKDCRFQKYDTPDLTIDTVLGIVNFKAMEDSEDLTYIKHGASIWGKTAVIWDEPNRASPMFISKLLEVVRTGTINGKDTGVRFQFGACNPPRATKGSKGHNVYFMGDAMASRFFHLEVPKSSRTLFMDAMNPIVEAAREAFNTSDSKKIAEICAPIANIWIEFSRAKPTKEQYQLATNLVAEVMSQMEASFNCEGFDMRGAIRMRSMLAECLLLNSIAEIPSVSSDANTGLVGALQSIVIGNHPYMSGLTASDASQSRPALEAAVRVAAQALLKEIIPKSTMSISSKAFGMLRDRNSSDKAIDELIGAIDAADPKAGIVEALTKLTSKVVITGSNGDRYRATQAVAGHKQILTRLIERFTPFLPVEIALGAFPDIKVQLNTGASASDLATEIHNTWYTALGLGKK